MLRRVFERAGHEVMEAGHGAMALELVGDPPPDLVVTDMMMPVMDGVEFIEHLRSDPRTAGIPILAVTGDRQLAGAADAITAKPFDWRELLAVAEDLMDTTKAGSS